jgi:hypothetical protein
MATTYTKLRDGSWGIRTTEAVTAGQTVTVTKKGGETKQETVGRVLWTGDGITLATVVETAARPGKGRSRGTWTGCSCGSVEEYERPGDCFTCRHDR